MSKKIKKNNGLIREKRNKIFAIFVCIFCFALCITLADLFSTIITVGSFSSSGSGKINSYSVFAVTLYESTIKSSAIEKSATVKKTNGAGYVWESNGKFYVVASAYIEENDAKKVKESLFESGYNSEILKISFDEIVIKNNFNNEELNSLLRAGNLFKETFKSLYDISISLDTTIITETQCRLEISSLQSEVVKVKSDFEVMFNSKINQELLKIKTSMAAVNTLLQQLIDFEENFNQTFSSKIKYNYMEILFLNKNLSQNLNNV